MTTRSPTTAHDLIEDIRRWAEQRSDVRAMAVVGSHARGDARVDSDLDLVLLCTEPASYLHSSDWAAELGDVVSSAREDWGKLQSVRVFYRSGPEVEFGFTTPDWADVPAEPGTLGVVHGGLRILLDRDGALARLVAG